ncbi:Rieske-like 2Fe-2S protein [Actinocorallia herbida]|uniref:Rieske-like 2Fe-2S protein n=1 Tax=Actinocorallia herbida TaxID=58109 RepID=A0A3N1D1U0_9ACTN|nr:aromatic ring-hydroxylating dioxygenase subunit alpha [Actinocorallia herbida]ROO87507.1 Rieske-like 2Fe-2S protein [Actinocorallia herbida]
MAKVLEPRLRGETPWFDGDVPPEQVPEKYRLARAYVPKDRYLDPEFQKLELERVFGRAWLMACRLEELPGVGCFVEYEIGSHSILIVRESKDSIRAYHNACRHRGTRLARGRGRVGSLICPFHGWRWNLDGSIRLVLDREEFVPRSDDDLGLVQVRAEQWGGFVFITMDPDARPLLEYLDPIPRIFAPFQFEHMRYRWMKGVILPCNWKTALDGFLEAYHVPGTHPQLFRFDKSNTNIASLKELENRVWSPTTAYERHAHYSSVGKKKSEVTEDSAKDPSVRDTEGVTDERLSVALAVQYIADDMRGLENERSRRAAEALKTAEVPEGMTAGQYFMQLYRDLSIAEGYDWPDITPEQWAEAGTAWNVFPNTILLPNQGSVFGYRARPNGNDPDSCLFEIFSLDQIPVADYDKKTDFQPEFFEDFRDADLGEIFTQDLMNAKEVTVGMHSPSFDGHRLSEEQEMTIYNHHRVADRFLWRD